MHWKAWKIFVNHQMSITWIYKLSGTWTWGFSLNVNFGAIKFAFWVSWVLIDVLVIFMPFANVIKISLICWVEYLVMIKWTFWINMSDFRCFAESFINLFHSGVHVFPLNFYSRINYRFLLIQWPWHFHSPMKISSIS